LLSMLGRENRITDASLIGHAVHSATLFASTSVVALAALLGMLGNLDRAHAAVESLAFADRAAAVLSLAVGSFDAGIRAYFFALAALAWLLGPGAFALATGGIVAMPLWRQFGSAASEAIRRSEAALADEEAAGPESRRVRADEPGYSPGA